MTLVFIIITCIISVLAFNNDHLFLKMQFNPYQVYHRKQYYRLISHGFIHADWMHLIVNMIVLYSFGTAVETYLGRYEMRGDIQFSKVWFTILYLVGIVISSLLTLKKQKDNPSYNAVGASGAVSAVTFCAIFFAPYSELLLYAFIPIPGIVFGILYLVFSQYMSRRGNDNINHDAHFVGAVFGFLFPLIIKFQFIHIFLDQVLRPFIR
jgi:membrane associated rhomboid family serine protease